MIMIEVLLDCLIWQRKKKIRLILIHPNNSVFDGLFNNVQRKPLLIKETLISIFPASRDKLVNSLNTNHVTIFKKSNHR